MKIENCHPKIEDRIDLRLCPLWGPAFVSKFSFMMIMNVKLRTKINQNRHHTFVQFHAALNWAVICVCEISSANRPLTLMEMLSVAEMFRSRRHLCPRTRYILSYSHPTKPQRTPFICMPFKNCQILMQGIWTPFNIEEIWLKTCDKNPEMVINSAL